MSDAKTLHIRFEKWDAFKGRVKESLKKGKPSVSHKHVLIFNSVVDYQKFMTEQKLAILATILTKKPSSIYQLAQLVERDFANVQRDCTALEAMGFIRLDDGTGSRGSKVPALAFGYSRIVIQMSQVSYAHELNSAA
jgi:predicted transcriptional regulator